MDGMYVNHKLAPHGWGLWAAAAGRWLLRTFGTNPGVRDPWAAAVDPALQRPPEPAAPTMPPPAARHG